MQGCLEERNLWSGPGTPAEVTQHWREFLQIVAQRGQAHGVETPDANGCPAETPPVEGGCRARGVNTMESTPNITESTLNTTENTLRQRRS